MDRSSGLRSCCHHRALASSSCGLVRRRSGVRAILECDLARRGGTNGRRRRENRRGLRRCAGATQKGTDLSRRCAARRREADASDWRRRLSVHARCAGDLRSGQKISGSHSAARRRESPGCRATRQRHRPARRRRSDLHPADRLGRGGVVDGSSAREPALDPRQREAHLQRRRKPRGLVRCLRRRNRHLLLRDARYDAVCELPAAEWRRRRAAQLQRQPRRRDVPEQFRQQAVLHRQRRTGSAVSDIARRAVHQAHGRRRRRR